MDILHTCLLVATSWTYLIVHFGEAGVADTVPWCVVDVASFFLAVPNFNSRTVVASIVITVSMIYDWYEPFLEIPDADLRQ